MPGSTLTSTSATFNWTAGSGVSSLLALCRQQRCGLGQHPLGRRDADLARGDRASGFRHAERPADVLHQQRLQYNDYTYTMNAASKAVMSSPTPGSTLDIFLATFSWTAGSGVSNYWLYVAAMVRARPTSSARAGRREPATVTGLPASGTLYVRLMSYIGSGWQYNDYTYTDECRHEGGDVLADAWIDADEFRRRPSAGRRFGRVELLADGRQQRCGLGPTS